MVCLLTEAFGDIKKKHKKKEEGANYISKNLLSEFKPLDHNFNESMNTNEYAFFVFTSPTTPKLI